MAPRNALIIANPASNHGEAARSIEVVSDLVEHLFPHRIVVTDGPEHATTLAEEAQGFDVVVAMGGDGTVHEVLQGLMRHPEDSRPALTVIPVGSGNDYARTLGISRDVSKAVMQIASGKRRLVDVGVCNGRYFANTIAIGLDAQVTVKAVELKQTTGRSGLYLYLSALMHVLFKDFRTYEVEMAFDGEEPSVVDMTLIVFSNGPTYGGGFHITPNAVGDDGLLDVCRIAAIPLWQALWRIPFVIPGKHEWMRPVFVSRHSKATLSAPSPVPAQIDGEVLLEDHYSIEILPSALPVLVPSPAS
ncbi:MAG: diacylglycerol kinase family lipid kinase [Coriobacteriia bacterium]